MTGIQIVKCRNLVNYVFFERLVEQTSVYAVEAKELIAIFSKRIEYSVRYKLFSVVVSSSAGMGCQCQMRKDRGSLRRNQYSITSPVMRWRIQVCVELTEM
ncbi:hypothetical protein CEXT_651691 [Caerostris extrusa]|uniref:Uncharacterized protein n=1 Tax=Caerostris extrusa TaxID=172846 RepID=A0AAV4X6F0_CAEEX|nr:hypothetical protein CEXT_651691 [Caerostris extrusa]